jgi:hypothetical protein
VQIADKDVSLIFAFRATLHYLICTGAIAMICFLATSVNTAALKAASTYESVTGCIPAWEVVTSPGPGRYNGLRAIAVLGATDIWAVGYYRPNIQNAPSHALSVHWDGSNWIEVLTPEVGTSNALLGVAAISANDVWAVGSYVAGRTFTLVLHWNGTEWSQITSPSPGSGSSYLQGVTALSSTDVWAVGDYNYPSSQTLILHWDGTQWSHVSSPSPAAFSILTGVDFATKDDGWASGFYYEAGHAKTLILHWDGDSWTQMQSPNPSTGADNALQAITVIAANDVWAVGEKQVGTNYETLTLHWDGAQWTHIPSPTGPFYSRLYAVSGISANDVWAVGGIGVSGNEVRLLHWDGSDWSMLPGANPGTPATYLFGVASVSPSNVWTVGETSRTSEGGYTLIEHYAGGCSTPTPTPTATITPTSVATATPTVMTTPSITSTPVLPTATSTAIAPTPTLTSTATACPIQFTDVPPGSTFYSFVRCLACRGIVGGYTDGTFQPNSPTTRGQLAKIVSNSAEFNEPVAGQTFEDVPSDSTFYIYIERLASRSIIAGYPCGAPNEPCIEPDNRPYFRPNANITRGQVSKIVAVAKGLPAPAQGQQTFEDVLEGSTFWSWIEALADNGAIGGYPCGGLDEPCVEPDNRPYFRQGANTTRGQITKIVANTFFPGCDPP